MRKSIFACLLLGLMLPVGTATATDNTGWQIDVDNDGNNKVILSYIGRAPDDFDNLYFVAPVIAVLYDPAGFNLSDTPPEEVGVRMVFSCPINGNSGPQIGDTNVHEFSLTQLESDVFGYYAERLDLAEYECDSFPADQTAGQEFFAFQIRAEIIWTIQNGELLSGTASPYFGQTAITNNNAELIYTTDDLGGGCDPRFSDVLDSRPECFGTDGNIFFDDIGWLAESGITKGCNPPANDLFCPDDFVTRGQMAAFLVRGLSLVDDGGGNLYVDDDDSVFEGDIDRLGTAGVTRGCNPPVNDRFCPDEPVTRGQMAAFLVRALGLSASSTDSFVDDDGSVFERDIQALAASGITRGCNPPDNDRFCPDQAVTRGQMAAFLHRALG